MIYEDIKKRIEFLKKKINLWNYEYYALSSPTISDEEFDLALKELIDLEKQHPELISEDSPTKRVGGYISNFFLKYEHVLPMLSLSNQYSYEEIIKFDANICKDLKKNLDIEYCVEPKIDGISISLIYENGILKHAITRGDGKFGEDILENVKTIRNIPLNLNVDHKRLEIRGEIFMSIDVFNELNKNLQGNEKFSNPRNAASGAVKNLNSSVTATRKLEMLAYSIPDDNTIEKMNIITQFDVLNKLKEFGFKTPSNTSIVIGAKGIIDYIEKIKNIKNNFIFPMDGIVIKVNNINLYESIGTTSKFPKWATAYKFPPEIVTTKMLDIIQSIGRTGKVTYVAKLSPVNICGTIVSSATLHNAEYIKENDIRIGDIVKVFKAGEIIPKVIGPVLSERKNDLAVFTPISKCPFCGSLLEKQNNEIDQYCTNIACPERIIFSLVHFCSKECFDISDLSEKNIKKLYEKKIINKIQDLYCLDEKKDLIIKNDFKIKEKMFNKIWQSIQNSKNKSLEKLLFSIGIRHIGEATSRVLAEHFRNMDNLINANFEELSNLNDIGETVANSIINFFHNSDNLELINELKKNNVNMNYISNVDESILEKESIYYRKNVVVTGSFELSRYEIKNILKSKYDVNISENVTKNTNFLIVGENPGTKLEKANKLKIKIVTEKIW